MSTKIEPVGPFKPASTKVNTTSAAQSSRQVTVPHVLELYQPLDNVLDSLFPNSTPSVKPASSATEPLTHPFMSALTAKVNQAKTWNNADAYESTLSPTLDAFTSLSQSTDSKDFTRLLSKSWSENPELTLKLIWNLRSIHEGKSAREPFYRAFAWLYARHPRTAIANLRYLAEPVVKRSVKKKPVKPIAEDDMEVIEKEEASGAGDSMDVEEEKSEELVTNLPHGYWKDLLNILVLAASDELSTTSALDPLHLPRAEKTKVKKRGGFRKPHSKRQRQYKSSDADNAPTGSKPTGEEAIKTSLERDKQVAEQAKKDREEKLAEIHEKLVKKLSLDKSFRALYVTVARLFADALARDLGILREIADVKTKPERRIQLSYSLTLVGKWAPSVGGSHDRITNIATPIAELLYVGGHLPVQLGTLGQPLKQEVAHTLRSAYTRWVTSPLRRFLEVPEVAMSANQWEKIKYNRVPSKAMQKSKALFHKHDEQRFSDYLLAVAQGKKKISGATLLPHELLIEALKAHGDKDPIAKTNKQVVDGQWKALIDRVKESGTLENALAVCDVSGSMGSITYTAGSSKYTYPIFPAVALSIVLAQVARPPWGNNFITFSQNPELVTINPEDGLAEIAHYMVGTHWGMNTDFNAVFTKLILPAAKANKLSPEHMIKKLFVFTDMQFDQSLSNRNPERFKTEHQKIKEEFEAAGYEMPQIVYWNLAGAVAKPVTKDEEGVALVSGFSPGMLKIFLDGGEIQAEDEELVEVEDEDGIVNVKKKKMTPEDVMLKALSKESYSALKVYD